VNGPGGTSLNSRSRHFGRGRLCLRESLADLFHHGILLRKRSGVELGVHQVAIHDQLKATAAGRLQFEARDALFEFCKDLGRQTDGARLVISNRAIAKLYLHVRAAPFKMRIPAARINPSGVSVLQLRELAAKRGDPTVFLPISLQPSSCHSWRGAPAWVCQTPSSSFPSTGDSTHCAIPSCRKVLLF
jgi:hypothetical protein